MRENMPENLVKEAFEQHWLHGRHVENERLWFTTIYGAITTGIYTILGENQFAADLYPLLIVHIVMSMFGLIIALKLSAEYHRHNAIANRILYQFNPEFTLRPIESTDTQNRYVRYFRQIFTVKNSFFQIYIFLLWISVYLFKKFYSQIIPSVLELQMPTWQAMIILLIFFEVFIVLVYSLILKATIYFAKCEMCRRSIYFDKPNGVVECSKCKEKMEKDENRYRCPRCGYVMRFIGNKKVICENVKEHPDKKTESMEFRKLF